MAFTAPTKIKLKHMEEKKTGKDEYWHRSSIIKMVKKFIFLDGWIDGWIVDGCKSCFKDCLQQLKSNESHYLL